VGLREELNWFETKPLFGKGVVITRPQEQAAEFAGLLRAQGARVIHFPTIKIVPADDWRDLDRAIGAIGDYQWIIFTSVNGVGHFFRRLREQGRDLRDLKGIRICAIGPATGGAVEERGIRVDLVPESFISESVIEAFRKEDIKGSRILLPRAAVARDVIPAELAKLGATVDVVTVYRTVSSGRKKAELEAWLQKGKVDVITFTSSSTVTNFLKIMGRDYALPAQVKIACIGPVTAATAKKAGLKTDIMQESYTIPGLMQALVAYFSKG
jgi:uroporphyrinogen III methyltransferase/synthase